jgi:hypothetical protein
MKISILRPCAVITNPSGGATKRLISGEILEGNEDWEVRSFNSLIKSGFAIEIQGNGEPVEVKKVTKKKTAKKKAVKKVAAPE